MVDLKQQPPDVVGVGGVLIPVSHYVISDFLLRPRRPYFHPTPFVGVILAGLRKYYKKEFCGGTGRPVPGDFGAHVDSKARSGFL